MTSEAIEQCYSLYVGNEEARTLFHITKMTPDSEMDNARGEIIFAYLSPLLREIEHEVPAPDESGAVEPDAIARIIGMSAARLMYARMLFNNIYRTEYTTSRPDKLNGQLSERSEIMRIVASYRRMGIEAIEDLRKDYGLRAQPKKSFILAILGEEL